MVDRIPPSVSFSRISTDLQRISRDLADLQDQLGSGRRARDLRGLGFDASFAISTRSMLADTAARMSNAQALDARLAVQDSALDGARESLVKLREDVMNALVNNDGRFLYTALENVLSTFNSGLNATWAGKFVFSGEETDAAPMLVNNPEDLVDAEDLFRTPVRTQRTELDGVPFEIAPHAATVGAEALEVMRDLRSIIGENGASIGAPIDADVQDELRAIADRLFVASDNLALVQARNGENQALVSNAMVRLEQRDALLQKDLGARVDADATKVAFDLSQRQLQYESLAQVYNTLKELTLLNFLR